MPLKLPAIYTKGEPRTLIEADQANLLINALIALSTVKVVPDGFGKVLVGETSTTIDLTSLSDAIKQLVDDALEANGANGANGLSDRVTEVERRLNNASASGTCNPGGGLNISFTI